MAVSGLDGGGLFLQCALKMDSPFSVTLCSISLCENELAVSRIVKWIFTLKTALSKKQLRQEFIVFCLAGLKR